MDSFGWRIVFQIGKKFHLDLLDLYYRVTIWKEHLIDTLTALASRTLTDTTPFQPRHPSGLAPQNGRAYFIGSYLMTGSLSTRML